MNAAARPAAWLAVAVLAVWAAWRILAIGMGDRLADADPLQALEWDDRNPHALLALAQQQLNQGDPAGAAATARRLLEHEPLAANALVLLGQAAEMEGDRELATRIFSIARQRAPHAQRPLAWLIAQQLEHGEYAQALDNIDRLLRVSPGRVGTLTPLLLQLAERPESADALAAKLVERPRWRAQVVGNLIGKASAASTDRVLSEVQRLGGLDAAEMGRWIERFGRTGQWGEAYARWAGELDAGALARLTSVYNGGFESPPTHQGFDWRIDDAPGVVIARESMSGTGGSHAVQLVFLGRRVETIPLHQWILLSPGAYRLQFRAKAQDLRADRGVQWLLRCQETRGAELAASEALQGSFDWTDHAVDFSVPESACVAQELSLRNAGAEGPGKILQGNLWFDDLAIERVDR